MALADLRWSSLASGSPSMLLPVLGLLLFCWRLIPWRQHRKGWRIAPGPWPRVSIVVPARNEEQPLPALLTSLTALDYPDFEIIVVDDRSTDATAMVAANFAGVKVVAGCERPLTPPWGGKQWACAQGAALADGELLLFTDADTVHQRDSLKRAVTELNASRADLLSAPPYHANPTLWERLLGPFQLLLLAMVAPYGTPRPGRVFVIGQYLLFRREAYLRVGGHSAVAATMVEDLPLANRMLAARMRICVYRGAALFQVRMYNSLPEFIRGWRRNFRAGFAYASPLAAVDATLMIAGLCGGAQRSTAAAVLVLGAVLFMTQRQRAFGRFSWWGPWLWPWSVGLFCWITVLALYDSLGKRDLVWKGRSYPNPSSPGRS